MPDGPVFRSPDEVAEYVATLRLSAAEAHGWTVMDSLEDDVKERLYQLLEEVPRD